MLLICLALSAGAGEATPQQNGEQPRTALGERPRVIIETDAGGDPDDEQSLVRFLLYVNDLEVEGIIANRPEARDGENLNPERTGLGIVRRLIHAYGECYPNLIRHDPRYARPEQLLERTVAGYGTDAGVDLILAAAERKDPRPLWFCNWGTDRGSANSCLKRALDRVLSERGSGNYAAFKQQLRLASADKFEEHTTNRPPAFTLWVDTFRPELDGGRWYHRFSALTARAGGFDIERDVRRGHGPLGALYPTNTTHWLKEGDSMTFLYLVPNGLNWPEEPSWGGWAGRYGLQPAFPGKPYYWANETEIWHAATNRDNTLKRWAADLQSDFRARMDWCVRQPSQANHPPRVCLNGDRSLSPIRIQASPGSEVNLDAVATVDPDNDKLRFHWFAYPEAGTYRGGIDLTGTEGPAARFHVPKDALGKSIHVLLAVQDAGEPPLTRYRRAIVEVADTDGPLRLLGPLFRPPPEYARADSELRSPLILKDGTTARSGTDWTRRREEILTEWTEMMGKWPPVLQTPRLQILSATRRADWLQERVRIQIAPDQESDGWLLTPNGRGPFPAVLVVYYEPDTSVGLGKEPLRDFGWQLARRGFVTLSIGTPGGNAWKPDIGASQCQPLSYHAYVAANCWWALANLPAVDSGRIGVVGHSYGGKWALMAGALWSKFAAVAVSDPGIMFDETRPNVNYWEPWYLGLDPDHKRARPGVPEPDNPRTGAYKRMIETGHNLHELHALIAPRPFFVSGGSEDPPSRWLALGHAVEVNQFLGLTNRVAMSNRPAHAPTEESNAQLYAFFEHFLGDSRR